MPADAKTHTIQRVPLNIASYCLIAWCKSLLHKLVSMATTGRAHAPENEADAELREVFFAELADVTRSLQQACANWRRHPTDAAALKNLRRGFHTLKGSAPLVGASALSDFSSHLEQLIARVLEQRLVATTDLIVTVEQAIALLPAFAVAIRDARSAPAKARSVDSKVQRFLS